jgi:hypothetical protein
MQAKQPYRGNKVLNVFKTGRGIEGERMGGGEKEDDGGRSWKGP